MLLVALGNEVHWDQGLNCVGCQGSIVLGTRILLWIGYHGCVLDGVDIGGFVSIIGAPNGDYILAGLVGF